MGTTKWKFKGENLLLQLFRVTSSVTKRSFNFSFEIGFPSELRRPSMVNRFVNRENWRTLVYPSAIATYSNSDYVTTQVGGYFCPILYTLEDKKKMQK